MAKQSAWWGIGRLFQKHASRSSSHSRRAAKKPKHGLYQRRLRTEALEDRCLLSVSVGGVVWNDANANGIRDAGEAGVAGVEVELRYSTDEYIGNTDDQPFDHAISDASGHYAFPMLSEERSYYEVFHVALGYRFATAKVGNDRTIDSDPNTIGVTELLAAGQSDTSRDAGLVGAPGFGWALNVRGDEGEFAGAIARDAVGNVYVTGCFGGTADFDPGPDTYNLSGGRGSGAFVAKYTSAGSLVWARCSCGTNWADGSGIAVAADGSVCIMGRFSGIADFDPGPGIYNLNGDGYYSDIFVWKLDAAGNFVWARDLGGTGFVEGNGIALGTDGSVYTTGYFNLTADFDPGTGVTNLTSAGGYDGFVSKLDSAGDFVWVRSLGGTGDDQGNGVAVAADGSVYTTGNFSGTVDFDPGPDTCNLIGGDDYNDFVAKLDSAGNLVWARGIGDGNFLNGKSIAVAGDGSVYATGSFAGTLDFDPGLGTCSLTSAGDADVFVWKLDTSGNLEWARRSGGWRDDYGYGIAVGVDGSVYTTGNFFDWADFDPGTDTYYLNSNDGRFDVFVWKLDASGNFEWARGAGGNYDDYGRGIVVAADGSVYTTGDFQSMADFDPTPGVDFLTSTGRDAFVWKLDFTPPTVTANTISISDPSPALSGTVDDPLATIDVTVAGNTFATINNGDGTWSLPKGTITPILADGRYDVTVKGTDLAGNVGSDATNGELLVDTTLPTSSVAPLPQRTASRQFYVSVTGSDPEPAAGVPTSGVASYEIYVRVDAQAWSLWTTVPATNGSALFTGQNGHSYSFYSVAVDNAGNREAAPISADTSTLAPMAATTIAVKASASPSVVGQWVTFTAQVNTNVPGAGTPTGTVTFKDGTKILGAGKLDATGKAIFKTASLALGTHTITASYAGDTCFLAGNGSLVQSVKLASTTTLSASRPSSVSGQTLTFTAQVKAVIAGKQPSGTVTFWDGTIRLGTVAVGTSGSATLKTAALTPGAHTIAASYSGDASYAPTSVKLTQSVNRAATTVAVKASVAPSVFGQSVIFTAQAKATAPGAGVPTGSATFKEGTKILGTGKLDATGRATFSTAALAAGSHAITVAYAGDAKFTASSSNTTQLVKQAATTIVITGLPGPSTAGQLLTFTAQVKTTAPGAGVPTGTVTFKEVTKILGTGKLDATGRATFSTAALAPGSHTITAAYGGSVNYLASSGSKLQQVKSVVRKSAVATVTNRIQDAALLVLLSESRSV